MDEGYTIELFPYALSLTLLKANQWTVGFLGRFAYIRLFWTSTLNQSVKVATSVIWSVLTVVLKGYEVHTDFHRWCLQVTIRI